MSFYSDITEGRLRLVEVLERRGARLPSDPSAVASAALATRRCVFCGAKAECDAWLASGRRDGYDEFCPNSAFVAQQELIPVNSRG